VFDLTLLTVWFFFEKESKSLLIKFQLLENESKKPAYQASIIRTPIIQMTLTWVTATTRSERSILLSRLFRATIK